MLQTLDEFLEGLLVRKVFLLHGDYFTCSSIQESYKPCLSDTVHTQHLVAKQLTAMN